MSVHRSRTVRPQKHLIVSTRPGGLGVHKRLLNRKPYRAGKNFLYYLIIFLFAYPGRDKRINRRIGSVWVTDRSWDPFHVKSMLIALRYVPPVTAAATTACL
jgi:hypothetical protein